MATVKDMSRKQFEDALRRHGFKTSGFSGYWHKRTEYGATIGLSEYNGRTYRSKLAYILNTYDRMARRR